MVNDAQRNIDFYTNVLGLRLVKRTVNFDRPEVYHLYFGDNSGHPGTIITFFPWEKQLKGRIGTGQVGVTSYAIPNQSMSVWEDRLQQFGLEFKRTSRFGEAILAFRDSDGLELELIERQIKSSNHEIIGFAGATLFSAQPNKTVEILESLFGMECVGEEDGFLRFKGEALVGNTIDIKLTPSVRGLMGAGTVHHIALRANDEKELNEWRELLLDKGYNPTEVRDRNYFKSIYFHDEGGILFEIATDSPGFTVDESIEQLGEGLMLPQWLEAKREALEEQLPKVEVRRVEGNQS